MRALALALALIGCKKEDDTDDPFIPGIETNKDSSANVEPPLKLVHQVRFRAYVAWDPVVGEVVKPVIDGNADDYISAYMIQLSIDGPPGDDTSTYCDVVLDLEGMTLSPTAKTEGFPWGLDIPSGDKAGYENCTDRGFDVADFAEGWRVEDWAGYGWFLRFYAPLTPALEDWLTPDTTTTDFDINRYTGGDWWSDDAGIETDAESNYWYGYPMDDLHNVDFDTRLDQRYGMVDGNGDMTLGYYVFDQTVFWDDE